MSTAVEFVPSRRVILINAALFYVAWFGCVVGSAYYLLWPALLSTGILLVWQLHPARRHPSDLRVLLAAIIMGIFADSLWIQMGLLEFTEQRPLPGFSPVWIVALWAAFALTINHCLYWLKHHPILPVLSGTIGGPMSYYAGVRLEAVEYLQSTWVVSIWLAIGWTLAILALVKISRQPGTPVAVIAENSSSAQE